MWLLVLIFLLLILCWLFFAPLELRIDTRIPLLSVQWKTIGKASLTYEDETWLFKLRVLFFYKEWNLEKIVFHEKKRERIKKSRTRQRKPFHWLGKGLYILRTFRVAKWEIAIDTGDVIKNAWLYQLNFYSSTRRHLFVNFVDENYFLLVIRNAPWRLVYAFVR